MSRISPEPLVGIRLSRAVLCPNDDTVYDARRFRVCPTCQGEERVYLSRCLGSGAKSGTGAETSLGENPRPALAAWPASRSTPPLPRGFLPGRLRRIAVL